LDRKVAIQGYDSVAYFKQGKALKGKKIWLQYMREWLIIFLLRRIKAFAKSPLSYEPQYGGWCAFAIGDKVAIDPNTFKIIDGKLYLFYNAFSGILWRAGKDQSNLKLKADSNWKK
jgi:hypothetical protein